MGIINNSPTEKQKEIKEMMEKHASKEIKEIDGSNHALEDAEHLLEQKLENGEFEDASKIFSEIKTLEIHCRENGFEQEAQKWDEIVEEFRTRAKKILDSKMEKCREEIKEAEQMENKIHENIARHEAAENMTGTPIQNEFKAVKRDLEESEKDIEDAKTIAHGFNLEKGVQKEAHGLILEQKQAKRTLKKLAS